MGSCDIAFIKLPRGGHLLVRLGLSPSCALVWSPNVRHPGSWQMSHVERAWLSLLSVFLARNRRIERLSLSSVGILWISQIITAAGRGCSTPLFRVENFQYTMVRLLGKVMLSSQGSGNTHDVSEAAQIQLCFYFILWSDTAMYYPATKAPFRSCFTEFWVTFPGVSREETTKGGYHKLILSLLLRWVTSFFLYTCLVCTPRHLMGHCDIY